jgi:ATP-binding protein involved in chromosome partitioning
MSQVTTETVIECLKTIKGPDLEGDIVSLGLVSPIMIDGGKVIFTITVPSDQTEKLEPMRLAAQKAVTELDGVTSATVIFTAERAGGAAPSSQRPTASATPPPSAPRNPAARQANNSAPVPGIKSIVAVASGKGGVGKSTTSVNLAIALSKLGQKVGILDADIYGPSMPRLMGITDQPTVNGKILTPLEGHGVKVMSMGFLVEEDTPMIWRGPMVISALTQMLREVAWGDLDVLVVDMPPGTGDAQLTMSQNVPLAGAVIVSTPQDIALIDARKGLNMFRKVDVPILGIVENMSVFICPKCGERSEIFGHGGARDEAEKVGVPFLGEIPLHMDIRKNSDGGTPIAASEPDGPHAAAYASIAQSIIDSLQGADFEGVAPSITFE